MALSDVILAATLTNQAERYKEEGRYADAEPLYRRVLAINEKVRGPDHPSVALALNDLAELYKEEGRYADAEPLYKPSISMVRGLSGLSRCCAPRRWSACLDIACLGGLYGLRGLLDRQV